MNLKQLLIVAVLLTVAAAPALVAHEGHAHKVMGTVSAVHEKHLEVEDTTGKIRSMSLNEKTKILRGTKAAKSSEITVGERVVVLATETRGKTGKASLVANEVRLAAGAPGR
jgi:hypothetical protein